MRILGTIGYGVLAWQWVKFLRFAIGFRRRPYNTLAQERIQKYGLGGVNGWSLVSSPPLSPHLPFPSPLLSLPVPPLPSP